MEFSSGNHIVKLCLQAMTLENNGELKEAAALFFRAWKEAAEDFEKFLASYYIGRNQENISDKIKWQETALQLALRINDDAVQAAFPLLYSDLAESYRQSGDVQNAEKYSELASLPLKTPSDKGPFYHGTKADLQIGDLLVAGKNSNYKDNLIMNHIYFTALANGAGLAAALAKGDGRERVYVVQPAGEFENDPNVTNMKFPGNPTRSYRTSYPLKVIGEVTDWARTTSGEVQKWREKLEDNKGEIIN